MERKRVGAPGMFPCQFLMSCNLTEQRFEKSNSMGRQPRQKKTQFDRTAGRYISMVTAQLITALSLCSEFEISTREEANEVFREKRVYLGWYVSDCVHYRNYA